MKFDDSSLTGYLITNLKPLTEADPVILAKYVVALLKKDKPTNELQKLCSDNLVEFLGHGAKPFTAKLFQALEDGSIVRAEGSLDVIKKLEPTQPPVTVETHEVKSSSPKEDNLSSSSEPVSDPDDKEVSDDDDDDRNHKHRKRDARPHSFDNDVQEQLIRRPNRRRNKPYGNGQALLETDSQTNEIQKDYNPASERNIPSKFDKRRSDLTPLLRAPSDSGPRTRLSQAFRTDPGPRFDLSTSICRPTGRGRGRGTVNWSQHDPRFSPLDTLDFASHMASQGPAHPSLFVGTGLQSAASTQTSSWGGFGFIPGMSNRILDPLHPLGLQGNLPPTMTPSLNLGMPRQRCRDFEERGFCLRGDMCPMEHGLNRIVVEDVQSLSQFNLPVSIPSSHAFGVQPVSGPLPPVHVSSGPLTNSKAIPSKSSKPEVADDVVKLNGVPSTSLGADADVYDPDQPLWNNDRPDTSTALLRVPSPNADSEPSWDVDSSAGQSFRLPNAIGNGVPSRSVAANIGSQTKNSSVWERIGSGIKSETGNRDNNKIAAAGYAGNKTKEEHEMAAADNRLLNHGKRANVEIGSKAASIQSSRSHTDSGHKNGRSFPRASRTLYVAGVPQKSNKRDALLSHFKKFGDVIDIYIPLNSEKAFVQFSKREEAEAALKAPDAVMGNRFIKLFWANHDRILDEGQHSGHTKPVQFSSIVVPSSQHPVSDGRKENLPLPASKRSNTEPSAPVTVIPKVLLPNGPKAAPPVQKKPESLELLEELRRKQESLAKKRDDFRRQLDMLEKQAILVKKGDVVLEQAAKRHKVDVGAEAAKATTTRNTGFCTTGTQQDAENALDKKNSEGCLISPHSKTNYAISQQSLKNIKHTGPTPVPLPNRFKLDNRPPSFRILPPLPAGFADVEVLKDHFSSFGVISSVVLENTEGHTRNACQKPSENCSACITFSARHFAERAYQAGKCWKGHNLQFTWLTTFPNSSSDSGMQETSSSTPKAAQTVRIQADPMTGLCPSGAEKSTCSVISEASAVTTEEPNLEGESTNGASISLSKTPVESSQLCTTTSSCDHCTSGPDVPLADDGVKG